MASHCEIHGNNEVTGLTHLFYPRADRQVLRDDMTALLSKAGSNLTVKQLLDTLQEVLDFESSIAKKYATPVSMPFNLPPP